MASQSSFRMKQLCLIRHAKSDWDHPGLSDHDRILNGRGRRDSPRVAQVLRRLGVAPDLVVTSTATRAAATARMLAEGLGYPEDGIVGLPELYLAPPRTILRVVQGFDEAAETALVFGHNPGMHEAVNLLGSGVVEFFPTLATAWFELKVDHWGEVDWGDGRLRELILPRTLEDA